MLQWWCPTWCLFTRPKILGRTLTHDCMHLSTVHCNIETASTILMWEMCLSKHYCKHYYRPHIPVLTTKPLPTVPCYSTFPLSVGYCGSPDHIYHIAQGTWQRAQHFEMVSKLLRSQSCQPCIRYDRAVDGTGTPPYTPQHKGCTTHP